MRPFARSRDYRERILYAFGGAFRLVWISYSPHTGPVTYLYAWKKRLCPQFMGRTCGIHSRDTKWSPRLLKMYAWWWWGLLWCWVAFVQYHSHRLAGKQNQKINSPTYIQIIYRLSKKKITLRKKLFIQNISFEQNREIRVLKECFIPNHLVSLILCGMCSRLDDQRILRECKNRLAPK